MPAVRPGDLVCQRILKIHGTASGREERCVRLRAGMLIQEKAGAIKRLVPIQYIQKVEWDAAFGEPKVLLLCAQEYQDWHFIFPTNGGTCGTFHDFLERLNEARRGVPGAELPDLLLQDQITSKMKSKANCLSPKKVAAAIIQQRKAGVCT